MLLLRPPAQCGCKHFIRAPVHHVSNLPGGARLRNFIRIGEKKSFSLHLCRLRTIHVWKRRVSFRFMKKISIAFQPRLLKNICNLRCGKAFRHGDLHHFFFSVFQIRNRFRYRRTTPECIVPAFERLPVSCGQKHGAENGGTSDNAFLLKHFSDFPPRGILRYFYHHRSIRLSVIKEIKIEEQARRQRRKSKHHPMQVFPFIFYKRYFLHKTSLVSIAEEQKPSQPSAVFMTGLLYHNSENSRFFSAVLQ